MGSAFVKPKVAVPSASRSIACRRRILRTGRARITGTSARQHVVAGDAVARTVVEAFDAAEAASTSVTGRLGVVWCFANDAVGSAAVGRIVGDAFVAAHMITALAAEAAGFTVASAESILRRNAWFAGVAAAHDAGVAEALVVAAMPPLFAGKIAGKAVAGRRPARRSRAAFAGVAACGGIVQHAAVVADVPIFLLAHDGSRTTVDS